MLCLSKQENADAEDERDSVLLQVSATGPGPYIHLAALHQHVQRCFSLLKRKVTNQSLNEIPFFTSKSDRTRPGPHSSPGRD